MRLKFILANVLAKGRVIDTAIVRVTSDPVRRRLSFNNSFHQGEYMRAILPAALIAVTIGY
jgi:hypothetical protein